MEKKRKGVYERNKSSTEIKSREVETKEMEIERE